MSSSSRKKILPKEDLIKKKIKKINAKSMIQETINSCLEKNNINKLDDNREELLKMLFDESMKNYLEYVKNRTNKDGKEFLKKELELHNTKLKSILNKCNNEKNEFQNKYLFVLEENKNLKDKIFHIQALNKNLMAQIKQLQICTQNFEIQMQNIAKKKLFLDELFKRYPQKDEQQILKYLDDLKEGSLKILDDYHNVMDKLNITNKEQKEKEKEFKSSMNKLYLNNELLRQEKKDLEEQYSNKINNFDYTQKTNEELKNRNIYLNDTLFHLYNLLFKEFGLNRNITINNKFLDIKKTDFDPNFVYDHEIKNYIELMIKTMHHDSYDILFRETLGYLNMILRVYLPDKFHLRFQPIKAFKEIKDFIDLKMTKIEDCQNIIKACEDKIEQKDNEIAKLKKERSELNKEYNLYKNIVEKEFVKTNKIISQLKNTNSKKDIHSNEINYNKIYNRSYNNLRAHSSKFRINGFSNLVSKKLKIKRKAKLLNYEEIKSYKDNNNNNNSKEKKNKIMDIIYQNKLLYKTVANSEPKKIKKGKNNDKIIRENGNQQRYNDINKIKLLIDETNRLFLYKSRMNSTIGKNYNVEENSKNKNKVITYPENIDVGENIKNKIFKQINNLIKISDN